MDYFLTKKRFGEFEEELKELKTKRRIEVSERLKEAKSLGDLSENSEYLEARSEQERVERRIAELEDILKNVTLIKEGGSGKDIVDIGSSVEVSRDGKKLKFVIVGSPEAKPEDGFISNQSPLGKELLGKKAGESAVIEAPSGRVEYKIKKIS